MKFDKECLQVLSFEFIRCMEIRKRWCFSKAVKNRPESRWILILKLTVIKLHMFLTAEHLTKPSLKCWRYEVCGEYVVDLLCAIHKMRRFCALFLKHLNIYAVKKRFGNEKWIKYWKISEFRATQLVKSRTWTR